MGYSNLVCTTKDSVHLNTAIFSDLSSLTLFLISLLVYKVDHIQNSFFHTLINSRSTYYFIDFTFVLKHRIPIEPTLPIKLKLFDRSSNNTITETTFLSITFSSRDQITILSYLTSSAF